MQPQEQTQMRYGQQPAHSVAVVLAAATRQQVHNEVHQQLVIKIHQQLLHLVLAALQA
jgi:hypothetical protein